MKKDFTASAGGKTATNGGSSSPFDQIAALEAAEAERLQKELRAMEEEKREVVQALQEKDEQVDTEMKEAAREELKAFRESDLNPIVKKADADGEEEASTLESAYEKKEKGLVDELVEATLAYK